MEKNILAVIAVIAVVAVVGGAAFVVMNNGGDDGGMNTGGGDNGGGNPGGGGSDPEDDSTTIYRNNIIAPEESEDYTVSGLPEFGTVGDTIAFTVDTTDANAPFEVTVTDQFTTQTYFTGTTRECSFSMPNNAVVVTVTVYKNNSTDNFLTWASDNNNTIFVWYPQFEGDNYFDQMDNAELKANVTSVPAGCSGYFTSHVESIKSLNQNVIPDDAMTVTDVKASSVSSSGSNSAIAFTVSIDRTMIKEGTAIIVLTVENEHRSGDISELITTITVNDKGAPTVVNLIPQTITFDLSDYVGFTDKVSDLSIRLQDLDWNDRIYSRQYQDFYPTTMDSNNTADFKFDRIEGHRYAISVWYHGISAGKTPPTVTATSTNGVTFDNGVLTFTGESPTVTLNLDRG